jgi:hypothetical protein
MIGLIIYFKAATNYYGELAYEFDFGKNLLIWMTMITVSPDSTSNRFFYKC